MVVIAMISALVVVDGQIQWRECLTDVFCPQQIDEDWGCCHSAMFLTMFQKLLCRWKGSVVKSWNTWWSFVRSNFCWWKGSIMGNASRVWGVHCPGWGVDCTPLRKMRWYDFAKVQNALFCMLHVQDTQLCTSWNCTDMARHERKRWKKRRLDQRQQFPKRMLLVDHGPRSEPAWCFNVRGFKIITKMRKTGISKMQP